jgi:MYXO-CTERM domain-containing protein
LPESHWKKVSREKGQEENMLKIALSTGVIALAAGSAHGVTIYAMNNLHGGGGVGSQNALVSFDSSNPAGYSTIGMTGQVNQGFTGLDFDGSGNLWGYVGYASTGVAATGLYSVNVATGAATVQGTLSGQALQDLAWNPVTNQMYGINTVSNVTTLYSVNLATGATTAVGTFSGLPLTNLEVGLACDSAGNFYLHDVASDDIFVTTVGLNVTQLYNLPIDTNFSQGMTIDWSNGNQGYHAAIGSTPSFFSSLYTFNTAGSSYSLVGHFGTAPGTFPTFEGGDLAIAPIPTPGALALLSLAGLASSRRRRS